MLIEQALQWSERLAEVSDSARLDTELLLAEVLEKDRSYLFTWPDRALTTAQQTAFESLFQRRLNGEPVAYILGRQDFWSLDLEVSPATLIPRADTETLVEKALALLPSGPCRIADLGTGTGAIALAIARERPDSEVTGVDLIDEAVELADRNKARNGIANCSFAQGSWCQPLSGEYQMIVSNPPYIDPLDRHLSEGDVRFEPRSALVADDAGMADIACLSEQALSHLPEGGWLIFEHGYDQGLPSRDLLNKLGYVEVATDQDLAGNDRITFGRKSGRK